MTCHCGHPLAEDQVFTADMLAYNLPQRRHACPMGHAVITGAPAITRSKYERPRPDVYSSARCLRCGQPLGIVRNIRRLRHAVCARIRKLAQRRQAG